MNPPESAGGVLLAFPRLERQWQSFAWSRRFEGPVTMMQWIGSDAVVLVDGAADSYVLDGTSGELRAALARSMAPITALAVDPWPRPRPCSSGASAGTRIARGDARGHVELLSADGELLASCSAGIEAVRALAWVPEQRLLAAVVGRRLTLWSESLELVSSLTHDEAIDSVDWWQARGSLVLASRGAVLLVDPRGRGHVERLDWDGGLFAVSLAPTGRFLAGANHDGTVRVWDEHSGDVLRMDGYSELPNALAWSPDSSRLVTAAGSRATIWRFSGAGPAGTRPTEIDLGDCALSAIGAPRRSLLVGACGDGEARLWQERSGLWRLMASFRAGEPLERLAISPGGRVVAAGGSRVVAFDLEAAEA